ncbi:hypothetical protein niasHS_004043 [Heterodera schachtii]|uniref:Nuclear receptor domain-containing protein n=1 Tax=Heterodera schachtii TaxID=97005 RepID=A0ABD2JUK5_HETSC
MPSPSLVPISATADTANASPAADDDCCAVCADDAHGVHFGVQVCRACAAFFRRSTIAARVYRCRYDENCDIAQREVRCACRACRLAKCLALGMDPDAVQRHRDQIGPRQNKTKLENEKRRTEDGGRKCRRHSPPATDSMCQKHFESTNAEGTRSNNFMREIEQQKNMAKFEQMEMSNEEAGQSFLAISSAISREIRTEAGKLYAPLGEASPAAQQWSLLECALPSAFTAPPPAQHNAGAEGGVGGGPIGGGDSGNASASSSVYASPTEQQQNTFAVACCSSAIIRPQISPAFCALDNEIPLISEIVRGYRRFQSLRISAFRLTGISDEMNGTTNGKENEDKHLLLANYLDILSILRTGVSLGSEMIDQSFLPPQNAFPAHIKWTLLRNFLFPFYVAECSQLSARHFPLDDTRFLMSPCHFINLAQLDHFFAVEQCKMHKAEITRLFGETLRKNKDLFSDFYTMRISDEEFAGLMGIIFWDDQMCNLSAEISALARHMRGRLFIELFAVCSRSKTAENGQNSGERFCTITNKVHFTRKISQELSSHFSLANMSGSFEVDPFLHNFNPLTF